MHIVPFVEGAENRMKRLTKAFEGCDALDQIITNSITSREFTGAASSAARAAISTLFAKGSKSFNAVRILAAFGYGEDALIVTRSLLNLSFVAGYICAKNGNAEERATAWIANGYLSQKTFIEKNLCSQLPQNLANTIDWEKVKRYTQNDKKKAKHMQVDLWPKKIVDLAKGAGMEELYQAYSFISSPEHSDAWAMSTYMQAWDETGLHINMDPSDDRVQLSIEIAALSMANVFVKFCDTFQIAYPVEQIARVGSYFHDKRQATK